jgi:hypothetical protein
MIFILNSNNVELNEPSRRLGEYFRHIETYNNSTCFGTSVSFSINLIIYFQSKNILLDNSIILNKKILFDFFTLQIEELKNT